MTLAVTVLGSSGTYPSVDTACSSYLVQSDTTSVWLDCGSGSLANLQRYIDLADLDGIVCSHSHPDHWMDLALAVNALRYGLNAPNVGIPLYWTAETAELFAVVSGRLPEPTFAATVITAAADVTIGDLRWRFVQTDHPVETLACRVDHAGRSFAYTADTGNRWSLDSLSHAMGAPLDLAIVEATMAPDEADVVAHLTAAQAGLQATHAGVASLLLTHLTPGTDPAARRSEAATTFAGPIAIATRTTRYEV